MKETACEYNRNNVQIFRSKITIPTYMLAKLQTATSSLSVY